MAAILEVKNLVKKYGDFAAVKGISFDIQDGEIFSLLGPNGAGKTTTTRRSTYLLGTILGQVGTALVQMLPLICFGIFDETGLGQSAIGAGGDDGCLPEYNLMESAMKNTILRILIGTILFSLISGIVVSIIGLMLGWKTTQFSDGFFWAGVIMISIGFISFQGYSQRTIGGPPVYWDPADRAKLWAADTFHGKILIAVFGISGLLLFGLSFLVLRLF